MSLRPAKPGAHLATACVPRLRPAAQNFLSQLLHSCLGDRWEWAVFSRNCRITSVLYRPQPDTGLTQCQVLIQCQVGDQVSQEPQPPTPRALYHLDKVHQSACRGQTEPFCASDVSPRAPQVSAAVAACGSPWQGPLPRYSGLRGRERDVFFLFSFVARMVAKIEELCIACFEIQKSWGT